MRYIHSGKFQVEPKLSWEGLAEEHPVAGHLCEPSFVDLSQTVIEFS